MELMFALLIVVVASIVIMYACNSFDDAASYLGRNMQPGVRGATINAIGSSMPELMTALFLLFLYHDQDGFAAGIATTAGSAIFNAVIIPAVCIFAVRYWGVIVKGATGTASAVREKVREIQINKQGVLRDGFFLLLAEGALILFLGDSVMTLWMGVSLIGIYGVYFIFLARGFGSDETSEDDNNEDQEEDDEITPGKLKALLTLDFNNLLFSGKRYSTGSAWTVLLLATLFIAVACWTLAEAVMISARALDVPPYFTALILAAAATSVPDTVLSVKDAVRGDYDDAIGNAVGSNTFDITVALGLPLVLYSLLFGDVTIQSAEETQVLRVVLFGVTVLVLSVLLLSRRVSATTAWLLFSMYIGWVSYIIADMANISAV